MLKKSYLPGINEIITGRLSVCRRGILALSAVICVSAAFSQDNYNPDALTVMTPETKRVELFKNSTHMISESGSKEGAEDSLRNLLNKFYYAQFRHYEDPRAPYFMFLSRDGKLAMGIGGMVRLRGYFDWNGSIPVNGFSPYLISIPKNPANDRRLAATPAGTGLFFTVFGSTPKIGSYMAFFMADFSGYQNREFKIKQAYITAGDWTAGYTHSTFEDSAAEPQTIDGSGANGKNSHTTMLVRYMHTFKKNWEVGAGIEFPESSTAADGIYTKACSDWLPDLAAFAKFQWNDGFSHVRIAGLLRQLTYRDLKKGKNRNLAGWAIQGSAVVKVLPQMSLYGIASIGQGHESYTTDLACDRFDLIPVIGHEGELYAPTGAGFVFGAKYYFKPTLFANLCLSEQRYFPKENPNDNQYKYGLYGAANLYWDITPRFEVGIEYLAGKRMNFDRTHGNANRVTAMLMLSF